MVESSGYENLINKTDCNKILLWLKYIRIIVRPKKQLEG